MIVIADSGSTKTDWRVIYNNGVIEQVEGLGLNPNFHTSDTILEAVKNSLSRFENAEKANNLYFYGAGCSTEKKRDFLKDALSQYFQIAAIEVEHDLLGAARAACHKKEGIAAIL